MSAFVALIPHPSTPVASPVIDSPLTGLPGWLTKRGSDVRGWDRRKGHAIFGPKHTVETPSDLVLMNGLLRAYVGPRKMRPHLRVQAYRTGRWREIGFLYLSDSSEAGLSQVYVDSMTPERGVIVLALRNYGEVLVELRRGERLFRIVHGRPSPFGLPFSRYVGWDGSPPVRFLSPTVSVQTGGFARALRVPSGAGAEYVWPPDLGVSTWALALRWMPDASSATQPNSGIGSALQSNGVPCGTLRYYAADRTIRWEASGFTLSSAPLTFSASQGLFVMIEAAPGGATLTTLSDTVTGVVPALGVPAILSVGQVGATTANSGFDEGGFGAGPFGGGFTGASTSANGLVDNVMIFRRTLTPAERTALASSVHSYGGLPTPESDLVWYAPFDVSPFLSGSPWSGGMTYASTVDGGSVRSTDVNGFTKALMSLDAGTQKASGLALRRLSSPSWQCAAVVARTGPHDDLAHHLAQYAAVNSQEVLVH